MDNGKETYSFDLPEKLQNLQVSKTPDTPSSTGERLSPSSIGNLIATEHGLILDAKVKKQVMNILGLLSSSEKPVGTMIFSVLESHLSQSFFHISENNFTPSEISEACSLAADAILSNYQQ